LKKEKQRNGERTKCVFAHGAVLDYGSVTLNGITTRLMNRLQSVLNATARLVCYRISPPLRDLHCMASRSRTHKVPLGRSSVPLPQPNST